MPRELFETRSHSWHAVGLGEELEARAPRRAWGGLVVALVLIAGTLVVYYNRDDWLPHYASWVKVGTAAVLAIVGSAAVHWLVRSVSPRLFRRLSPATAGTLGFLVRLFAMSVIVLLALRVAGVKASTLALGGTITAVVFGLAAQHWGDAAAPRRRLPAGRGGSRGTALRARGGRRRAWRSRLELRLIIPSNSG
jgi:small conductance mechanosensitive channel